MKKWIFIAGLCLVTVTLQAQSYKDYVQKALDAMAADSLDLAENLFREAMRLEPAQRSNAMIYCQIGMWLLMCCRYGWRGLNFICS